MAEFVKSKKDCDVLLDNPVISITNSKGIIELKTLNSVCVQAKYCVCAVPITLQNTIHWQPNLPFEREQLVQRMPMASAMKVFTFYKTPFWKKNGFSGFAWSLNGGPITIIFDASRDDGKHPLHALLIFVNGRSARKWAVLPKEERKRDIINHLVELYGEEAKNCSNYVEKNWMEEKYSKGCFFCVPSISTMSIFGHVLRKPHFNVHFAGTETAFDWMGYIEGALDSGYRCADEILSKIKQQPSL